MGFKKKLLDYLQDLYVSLNRALWDPAYKKSPADTAEIHGDVRCRLAFPKSLSHTHFFTRNMNVHGGRFFDVPSKHLLPRTFEYSLDVGMLLEAVN